ncbi:hypothetical protein ACM55G_14795 [Flavobacterium sp. LB3P122]|uniref:hypothetical protein n=1 Tax=Flavobacterium algoriphilum TaxID=3398738 RepID=UPI003A89E54F
MIGAVDLYQLEKQLATRTTASLRNSIRSAIQQTTSSRTGEAIKQAGSRAVFKENLLQRITIRAPHYIFKQQHGFEGVKKNGVNMRLKATSVITQALNASNILEKLADEISEIRLSEVTAKINFK